MLMQMCLIQTEAPDLLEILQQKGLAEHVELLRTGSEPNPEAQDNTQQASLYSSMHDILARICEGNAGRWQVYLTIDHVHCGLTHNHHCFSDATL